MLRSENACGNESRDCHDQKPKTLASKLVLRQFGLSLSTCHKVRGPDKIREGVATVIYFREIEEDDAELLLRWRTSPEITRFMVSNISFDLEAQKRWIASRYRLESYYHWILEYNGVPVGFMSLTGWDSIRGIANWSYYVAEPVPPGVAYHAPLHFFKWAFEELDVCELRAVVFYTNTRVVRLNTLYGFKFAPERDHIIQKDGRDILMIAMALSSKSFATLKPLSYHVPIPTAKWICSKNK